MGHHDTQFVNTRLAEKRRGSYVAAALLFSLAVVLIVGQLSGCPGPPPQPAYLLIVAGNTSSLPPPYTLASLPADDESRLIDIGQFHFLLDNPICNGTELLYVVLVHSNPTNHAKRMAIRQTWGSQMKVIFLVGQPKSEEIQASLEAENNAYHDLVQGSFQDTYRNMTYKHVMGLKWIIYRCPMVKYILKTDDDVFVHPSGFAHHLTTNLSPFGARRLIECKVIFGARPSRSYRSKWRVSFKEYQKSAYPNYCSGFIVLYSPDVVFLLYQQAQNSDYFWIDDVFITGMMAQRANIIPSNFNNLILGHSLTNLPTDLSKEDFVFGPVDLTVKQIYKLWQSIHIKSETGFS